MDFAGEHHHGIALSCALGVPEDPSFHALFALTDRFNGPVDSEELCILRQDLLRFAPGPSKSMKFSVDPGSCLVADAFEQSFHVHSSRLLFSQAFPLVEVLPFAGDVPIFACCRCRTSQWRYVGDVRDGVQVVGEVFLEGGFEVLVDVLALDEQERQAVYEADDIRRRR